MIWRGLLCLLLLCIFRFAAGAELRLTGSEREVDLAPYLEAAEDTSAALDIAAVSSAAQFKPLLPSQLHPGYSESALWLKLQVANVSGDAITRWLSIQPPRLQEVSLFFQRGGRWQRLDAGSNTPFGKHPLAAIGAVFPLHLERAESVTLYVRVASQTSIAVLPTLWEPLAFREASGRQGLFDSFLAGGLVLTGIYALLMFFTLHDRAFLLHGIATLSYCVYEISFNGYGLMLLWPDATSWATHSIVLSVGVSMAGMLWFTRELLATRARLPRWDAVLRGLQMVSVLLALAAVLDDYRTWTKILTLLVSVILCAMLATVGLVARHHFRAVRYYVAAFCIMLAGNLWRTLSIYGVMQIPPWVDDLALFYPLVGNVFLLAAVIDRVRKERAEKEAVQQALLAAHTRYETQLKEDVRIRTEDLNAALNQARQANLERSRLLAYIGHDLRTPLATIIHSVRRLNRHASAEALKYQATIEHSAAHQLELIDDLVDYSRGELDQLELIAIPTYLHSWLGRITEQAELLAGQHGNVFSTEFGHNLPAVIVIDPKRLRQVLLNLISNAIKFTTDGRISLAVEAQPASPAKWLLDFSVQDTGQGIPPEAQEKIFRPFERLRSEKQGSGLGLSIARHIVRGMGSELTVDSTQGQGSRFAFRLIVDTAAEAEVMAPLPAIAEIDQFGTGKTILIIDSDAASNNYLFDILAAADFDVVTVKNGIDALQVIGAQAVHAILTEQGLPLMDGWQLQHRLHEDCRQHIPMLLVSALPPYRPPQHPPECRFDMHLLKPVLAEQLLDILRQWFIEKGQESVQYRTLPFMHGCVSVRR